MHALPGVCLCLSCFASACPSLLDCLLQNFTFGGMLPIVVWLRLLNADTLYSTAHPKSLDSSFSD